VFLDTLCSSPPIADIAEKIRFVNQPFTVDAAGFIRGYA